MLAAVVPMKSMDLAKSRLATVLDSAGRHALARRMLDHVLETLRQAGVASVRVASGDQGTGDLNADVTAAARLVESEGATNLLLVMADLPYLADPAPKTPRETFVFFINGAKVRAPHGAMALIDRLRG